MCVCVCVCVLLLFFFFFNFFKGEPASCSNAEKEEMTDVELSDKQRAQIERNRQRALLIRQARSQNQTNTKQWYVIIKTINLVIYNRLHD